MIRLDMGGLYHRGFLVLEGYERMLIMAETGQLVGFIHQPAGPQVHNPVSRVFPCLDPAAQRLLLLP